MPGRLQSDDPTNIQPRQLQLPRFHRLLVERLSSANSVWHLEDQEDPGLFRFLFLNSEAERITNLSAGFFRSKNLRKAFPVFKETIDLAKCLDLIHSGRVEELHDFEYGDELVLIEG